MFLYLIRKSVAIFSYFCWSAVGRTKRFCRWFAVVVESLIAGFSGGRDYFRLLCSYASLWKRKAGLGGRRDLFRLGKEHQMLFGGKEKLAWAGGRRDLFRLWKEKTEVHGRGKVWRKLNNSMLGVALRSFRSNSKGNCANWLFLLCADWLFLLFERKTWLLLLLYRMV